MIALSLKEVARITGARIVGDRPRPTTGTPESMDAVVIDSAVVTDARQCGPGGLYIARVGEHADGLDYVPQAIERGAAAVLAARPADGLPTLVVDDVQAAFAALARAVVDRVAGLSVVAVTGSSGKTSTKDLLAQVLGGFAPTIASEQSYNGEIGVPLTALRISEQTRCLVVEMGARGPGHIAYLTRIAPPDIAVVLNVGSAHRATFGTLEATAAAKAELVQALPATGVAVLNADDPLVSAMAGETDARVIRFGRSSHADVRAVGVRLDDQARASFELSTPHGSHPVRLRLHGEHHVGNALATAAVAGELGQSPAQIAQALSLADAGNRWRMQVSERPDGVRIVNDAYNANPESMRAALKALIGMGSGRRTWAVLGEMLELGPQSGSEHEQIGRFAASLGIDRLVAVGPGAQAIHQGAGQVPEWAGESVWVADQDAAFALLCAELGPTDVVLFKSSRDAGLRLLGDRIAAVEAPR